MSTMLAEYREKLVNEAKELKYTISHNTMNKAIHSPHYIIVIKESKAIEDIYSFAHEVGHAADFRRGKLDFERYKRDKKYRIKKEFIAWWLGFQICRKTNIPITKRFYKHAYHCFKSYL